MKNVHLGLAGGGPAAALGSLSCSQAWAGRAGTELWEPHLRPSLSGFQLQNLALECNPIYLFIVWLLDVKLLKEPPPHKPPCLCEGTEQRDMGTPPSTPGPPPW